MPTKKTTKKTVPKAKPSKSLPKYPVSKVKKTVAAKPETKKPTKKRDVRLKPRLSFRQELKERRGRKRTEKIHTRAKYLKISGAYRIFRDSLSLVRQHWKFFLVLTLIYTVLTLMFVGIAGSSYDLNDIKSTF